MAKARTGGDPVAASPGRDCHTIEFERCVSFSMIQSVGADEVFGVNQSCLYHSSDGARHWEKRYCADDSSVVEATIDDMQFVNPMEGWLVSNSQILHTRDGGRGWAASKGEPFTVVRGLRFADKDIGYWVGEELAHDSRPGKGVIFGTKDGGETWLKLRHEVERPYPWRLRSVWPTSRNEAWVVGDATLHSTDQGYLWTIVRADEFWRNDVIRFATSKVGWIQRYPAKYFLMTLDGGRTWQPRTLPAVISDPASIAFIDERQGWATFDGRVHYTQDGALTWQEEDRCVFPNSERAYQVEHLRAEHKVAVMTGCSRILFSDSAP